MAVSRQRKNIAYGIGTPLQDIPTQPVSSNRAPTTSDKAEIGTVWVYRATNAAWVLASIVSNSATWTPMTVNAGATITTGNLTVTAGDVNVIAGDIVTTAGSIESGGGIVAAVGDVLVSAGDISVTLGDIEVDAGSIEVALGEIVVTTLDVTARGLFVTGDEGTGTVAEVGFTNVVDTTLSTGAGVVLMKTANPGDSAGWLKFYEGTNVRYIPYWSNLSP